MKKKDLENLHAKTVDELKTLVSQLEGEIVKLQIDLKTGGKLKNTNEARLRMKDRARALTLITQKKRGEVAKA